MRKASMANALQLRRTSEQPPGHAQAKWKKLKVALQFISHSAARIPDGPKVASVYQQCLILEIGTHVKEQFCYLRGALIV